MGSSCYYSGSCTRLNATSRRHGFSSTILPWTTLLRYIQKSALSNNQAISEDRGANGSLVIRISKITASFWYIFNYMLQTLGKVYSVQIFHSLWLSRIVEYVYIMEVDENSWNLVNTGITLQMCSRLTCPPAAISRCSYHRVNTLRPPEPPQVCSPLGKGRSLSKTLTIIWATVLGWTQRYVEHPGPSRI